MDLPAGYELRAPSRGELEAVADVVVADELYSTGHVTLGTDFVRGEWSQPGFELATDAWAVIGAGATVVGYGQARLEEPALVMSWGAIHPDHRGKGIGSALFARVMGRASAMLAGVPSGQFRHAIYAHDRGAAAILRAHGLLPVRHFWHMQVDLARPLETVPAPVGVQIGGIVPPDGVKIAYEVINEALADNWDYQPMPFDQWIAQEQAAPGYDPTLWLLATQAGTPVAAFTGSIGEDRGWVDYLGVLAPYRGRGIAVSLLHRAFAAFAERGVARALVSVDAGNATGATAVYERAGMRTVKAWDMWERSLSEHKSR